MITCTFENGQKAELRHVTVGALVLNNRNQILLIKRAPHTLRGNKYDLPAGFLDRDETTQQCAIRELHEETGIEGEIISLFRIVDRPDRLHEQGPEGRQNVDFVYIVRMIGGIFTDNDEVTEIKWFLRDELPSDEEFAFDHRDSVLKYFDYLKKPFPLPIIG